MGPQQPELRRSKRTAVDQDTWEVEAGKVPDADAGGVAPVPEDNLPGHHPEQEQDKPEGPPGATGEGA